VLRAYKRLAETLLRLREFDAAERSYEEARRDVADDDPIYRRVIQPSDIQKAGALIQAGRSRDALEILTPVRLTGREWCSESRDVHQVDVRGSRERGP